MADVGWLALGGGVDELVVLINNLLPFCAFVILKFFGTLPGSQRCISLTPAQLWFTAWSLWRPGVPGHVEDCDAVEILLSHMFKLVEIWS